MDTLTISSVVNKALSRFSKWRVPLTDIEDLRQEAWLAALEAVKMGVDDEENLQRLIENHLTNFYRHEAKYYDAVGKYLSETDGQYQTTNEPESHLWFWEWVKQTSPTLLQQQVVFYRYIEDFTQQQTADQMSISHQRVDIIETSAYSSLTPYL